MRRAIHDSLDTPWGFRITCGVLFVILMGLVRYGLHVFRETHDRTLILSICIPFIVCGLGLAWLIDRHNARPH